MVPTPLVGRPEALILYSGDREVFDRHVDVLRHLGGTAEHVGADHGAASLHDVAMLEVYFAGMTAFLHAAAMVTAQGMSARDFLPFARQIAALLPETFAGLAAEVDAGRYPGTEDRLTMELAALEHIVGEQRGGRPGREPATGAAGPRRTRGRGRARRGELHGRRGGAPSAVGVGHVEPVGRGRGRLLVADLTCRTRQVDRPRRGPASAGQTEVRVGVRGVPTGGAGNAVVHDVDDTPARR